MKQLSLTIIILLTILALPSQTFASLAALAPTSEQTQPTSPLPESSCSTIYNGGVFCQQAKNFVLDKTILNPQSGKYVDSIDPKEHTIQSDRTALFRLKVTNTSKNTLKNIVINDMLPAFTTFKNASNNTLKVSNDTISYTISALAPGATNTQTIETTTAKAADLPSDTVSVANQAQAKQGNDIASDIVTFSIQKFEPQTKPAFQTNTNQSAQISTGQQSAPQQTQNISKGGLVVYPAPQTNKAPSTGPELLGLIVLIPSALIGLKLRK